MTEVQTCILWCHSPTLSPLHCGDSTAPLECIILFSWYIHWRILIFFQWLLYIYIYIYRERERELTLSHEHRYGAPSENQPHNTVVVIFKTSLLAIILFQDTQINCEGCSYAAPSKDWTQYASVLDSKDELANWWTIFHYKWTHD